MLLKIVVFIVDEATFLIFGGCCILTCRTWAFIRHFENSNERMEIFTTL